MTAFLEQCALVRVRQKGSGAGGQRKNKVQTGVRLTHAPSGLTVVAAERREPEANRKVAVFRLRLALAVACWDRWGAVPTPTAAWRSRVRDGRLSISPTHDDLPGLMAEAMAVIARAGWDVASAATQQGVSTSQLVKLLSKVPAALAKVNQQRKQAGMSPLAAR